MKERSLSLAELLIPTIVLVLLLAPVSLAHWQEGDSYKMHFPQLPDEDGWDVNASYPARLADDWRCTESGPVKDIHFWGSWKGGIKGTIDHFTVSIWSNLPVGHSENPNPYSMPGEELKAWQVLEWEEQEIDAAPLTEGWFDPSTGLVLRQDHTKYIQYNVTLDEEDWFWQERDTIYWLPICARGVEGDEWGWKTADLSEYPEPYTGSPYEDDAVWDDDNTTWQELFEPSAPNEDVFWVAFPPFGELDPEMSGGTGFEGWWFFYPETFWWNIWFFDHSFVDPDRLKVINIRFDLLPFEPDIDIDLTFAVNWSTDLWEDPQMPPLPVPGFPEEVFIGRDIILPPSGVWEEGTYDFYYVIRDYNPIWVSIDVRGSNFVIPFPTGEIVHDCVRQSLDLAFVITGGCTDGDDCDPPTPGYSEPANTVAASYGKRSLIGSGVFNQLVLLLIPVGALIVLRIWRRRR